MKIGTQSYYLFMDMLGGTYRKKPNRFSVKALFLPSGNKGKSIRHSNLLGSPTHSNPVRVIYLLLLFFILASCEKDAQPQLPPSIQLIQQPGSISSDTLVAFGDLMTFTIKASGGSDELTNLYAIRTGTQMIQTRALDTSMNIFTFQINKSFTKNLDNHESWTFVVRDKNRLSDSVSVLIHLDTASGFGPIHFYESVQMSAQNLATPGSFLSFADGVMGLDQAMLKQESIDLLYYYFGEDENVIASPGANVESGVYDGDLENWSIRNTTRFIELDLPAEGFYAAQNDSLLVVSYSEGSGKRKAKNLATGKTFSFKTQDAVFGMFRVLEVEGTDAGTLKVDIKIQDKQ